MAKSGGKRRDPARERFWRRTIRDQQRSGLSVRDFCRREGLKDGIRPVKAVTHIHRNGRGRPGLGSRAGAIGALLTC